jgi:hypothetical protein
MRINWEIKVKHKLKIAKVKGIDVLFCRKKRERTESLLDPEMGSTTVHNLIKHNVNVQLIQW